MVSSPARRRTHSTSLAPSLARTRRSLRFATGAEVLGAPIDLATFDGDVESYVDEGGEQYNHEAIDQHLQLEPIRWDGGSHQPSGAARSPQNDDAKGLDYSLLAIDIADDSPFAVGLLEALHADMIHHLT